MARRAVILLSLTLASFFFVLITTTPSASAGGSLVIGSYRAAGTKSTDEYVEIYNPGTAAVNLAGWSLAKKTSGGSRYVLVAAFPPVNVAPGESVIVGHKDSVEKPDVYYSNDSYSISEDNTIILASDKDGKAVVDKVGFGKATEYEEAPAPTAGTDLWIRKNGLDTDNNMADFKKVTTGPTDYSGLCLSEIMPSPAEGEEWIEVYNSEMAKDIGGMVIADKLGAIKKYTVPVGTVIPEGGYLIFYKKDTGITLNDDGDGVVLIDATGAVFDDTGASYGKAEKGYSYAFNGKSWGWTALPTPGAANKVAAGTTGTINSKKRTAVGTTEAAASTKGTVPEAEVLGATDTADDIFAGGSKVASQKDQLFGLLLLGVALGGGLVYTGYVNREKLVAAYYKERKRYYKAWRDFRAKLPRG